MKSLISFSKFIQLPEELKEELSTFENEYLQEELSPSVKKKKMVELERRLKHHDWYSEFGDMKAFRDGQKEEQEIRKLIDLIGDDGMELYRQYGKKAGVIEGTLTNKAKPRLNDYEKHLRKVLKTYGVTSPEELEDKESGNEVLKRFWKEVDDTWKDESEVDVNLPEDRSSKTKLNQFSRLLKNWDYTAQFSDDHSVLRKSEKYKDEIIKLRDGLGDEGRKMYFSFLKSKGILPSGHLESKGTMENKSMFPDQNVSERNIQLGYGEERPVGGKSNHGFVDAGNLYPEHLVPKWIPPSPQRKRGWSDK